MVVTWFALVYNPLKLKLSPPTARLQRQYDSKKFVILHGCVQNIQYLQIVSQLEKVWTISKSTQFASQTFVRNFTDKCEVYLLAVLHIEKKYAPYHFVIVALCEVFRTFPMILKTVWWGFTPSGICPWIVSCISLLCWNIKQLQVKQSTKKYSYQQYNYSESWSTVALKGHWHEIFDLDFFRSLFYFWNPD